MNRKIMTLLLILIAASAITIVSAADTQTINGVEFNVPDGYTYDADSASAFKNVMEDEKVGDVGVFKNSNDELLVIMVYDKDPGVSDLPNDYELENKTINNKNGTLMSAPSRENIGFTYADGDKYIVIQAMNEDVLKQTIIA